MNKIYECKGDKGYRIECFIIEGKMKIIVMNRNNNKKYTRENANVELLLNVITGCDLFLGKMISYGTNVEGFEELASVLDCENLYYKEPY